MKSEVVVLVVGALDLSWTRSRLKEDAFDALTSKKLNWFT